MLNLSIMPLDLKNIDEICEDAIKQQREGVSTVAMFMMKFAPEGTPAVNKAEEFCKTYEIFRERLDKANAKSGVLVQSTLGHIYSPNVPHSFQNVESLVDGSILKSTCCPLDKGFRAYIKEQFRILASHHPSCIMIDDDIGLLYRSVKGCTCPLHMAEFNRRAKTNMTREELYAHTQGNTEEDRYYTDIYVNLQREALEGVVAEMRAGIDEVDPTIQGIVSGIYQGRFCEFTDVMLKVFSGENNLRIARLNNGMYTNGSGRGFTSNMYRAAVLREFLKDKVDILLAETDTCPHNRYSTSATMLHAHFAGTILEGAKGAKHWITRLNANEPKAGIAYRKVLAKYNKFYEELTKYFEELKPVGCCFPISLVQDYGFKKSEAGLNLNPWGECVLERFGLPLYFSSERSGAVFLDDISATRFTDEQISSFFRGTVILSAVAAKKLNERGFSSYTGVDVQDWTGENISYELINGHKISVQTGVRELRVCEKTVQPLSYNMHATEKGEEKILFPAVTGFLNSLGGYTVVFSGTPDTLFHYSCAFSMLNQTRKEQFVEILKKQNNLPVYYPDDAEIYLRAGYLNNGELFCAVFNLGLDVEEELTLGCDKQVSKIEKLNSDGTRSVCEFYEEDSVLHIRECVQVLNPIVLFLSYK